jgi:hypothetical protein
MYSKGKWIEGKWYCEWPGLAEEGGEDGSASKVIGRGVEGDNREVKGKEVVGG